MIKGVVVCIGDIKDRSPFFNENNMAKPAIVAISAVSATKANEVCVIIIVLLLAMIMPSKASVPAP